jgi:DNA polymerase-3 subunit delta
MNRMNYQGKDLDVKELIDIAETMPFFSERRLISIQDSGVFKNSNEELAQYLTRLPETTCIVFCETEVDKRNKVYKAVKEHGYIAEFTTQKQDTIEKWVLGRIRKENKKITAKTLSLFLYKTGLDMGTIDRELEKLLTYTLEKDTIEEADVNEVCCEQTTNRIFDMVEAIARHNRENVFRYYTDLIELKEPPVRILYLVARQYMQLFQIKELRQKGMDERTIASRMKLPPFVVRKNTGLAERMTKVQIKDALDFCAQTEEEIKTGAIADRTGLELVLVKLSKND